MAGFINKYREALLDILFPPICLICGRVLGTENKNSAICSNCLNLIPIAYTLTCPECRARLAENKKICHRKAGYRLAAASNYENEKLKRLLWLLKYQKKTVAAEPIGEILRRHIENLGINFSGFIIIPIPLHQSRERERGFNQSFLIAQSLSRRIGLEIKSSLLRRIKNTPPQAEARNFETRAENIKGCFIATHPETAKGLNILLLDDVFTSGATIGEAVKTLKAAGAKRVVALIAAKAG
ncbi:MAG TPA: double zinc ribbon domain-containing protein [Candidatus Paceibacterota bacterium]